MVPAPQIRITNGTGTKVMNRNAASLLAITTWFASAPTEMGGTMDTSKLVTQLRSCARISKMAFQRQSRVSRTEIPAQRCNLFICPNKF